MRLMPLCILSLATFALACAPAQFRKVASDTALMGSGGAVPGSEDAKGESSKSDGAADSSKLPELPSVPPCFTTLGDGSGGDYPSQNPKDPAQNPEPSAGQNNPGQNPGQNPNQNPGQNPGQNPNQNPGQNPGQNPETPSPPPSEGDGEPASNPAPSSGDGDAGEQTTSEPVPEHPC